MCPAQLKCVLYFWCCSVVSMCFLCCKWKTLSWVNPWCAKRGCIKKSRKSKIIFFSISHNFFVSYYFLIFFSQKTRIVGHESNICIVVNVFGLLLCVSIMLHPNSDFGLKIYANMEDGRRLKYLFLRNSLRDQTQLRQI